jgi:hypothetical protein
MSIHNIGKLSALAVLACASAVQGQVFFTGQYTQNFDGLGPTGTSLPEGWSGLRGAGSGTLGQALVPAVSTGSSTGGGIYNVGTSGSADRALGALSSGSTVPRYGVQLVNQTGGVIHDLSFSAMVEQWRSGANNSADESLVFEYSLNATGIGDAAALFVPASQLNLREVTVTTTSAGALNGNDPANSAPLSAVLPGLDWAPGSTLTLRWSDADDPGSDGMLALDDLRIKNLTAVPEPSTWALLALGACCFGWLRQRRRGET